MLEKPHLRIIIASYDEQNTWQDWAMGAAIEQCAEDLAATVVSDVETVR